MNAKNCLTIEITSAVREASKVNLAFLALRRRLEGACSDRSKQDLHGQLEGVRIELMRSCDALLALSRSLDTNPAEQAVKKERVSIH